MIAPGRFDDVANAMQSQYEMFLSALRSRYATLTDDIGVDRSLTMLERLREQSYSISKGVFDVADLFYSQITIDVMADLHKRDLDLPKEDVEEMRAYLEAQKEQTIRLISATVLRDTNAAMGDLRRLALQFSMMIDSGRLSPITARLRLMPGRAGALQFSYVDRANRRWKSTDYVRVVSRAFAYQSYIETAVFAMAKRGIDLVKVTYPNVDHTNFGKVFSISGAGGYDSYFGVEYFHPNSEADVEPA